MLPVAIKSVPPGRTLRIDDEGFLASNQIRWSDIPLCYSILESLRVGKNGAYYVTIPEQAGAAATDVLAEAFDDPLVARHIENDGDKWFATFPYEIEHSFELSSLKVDEWDRFHGRIKNGLPFAMSRNAQNDFFNLVDEFEDEAFKSNGITYATQPWLTDQSEKSRDVNFWQNVYQTKPNALPWELNEVHPALVQTFKQMKFNRSRIAVLGAGGAHDAAWLAQSGHMVTAFDFSKDAIELAKKRYGSIDSLKFEHADVLKLSATWNQKFDVIVEHTCYCAIPPQSRAELVRTWRRMLIPTGHYVGIHFVMDRNEGAPDFRMVGPPFGATEWEIRQRLQSHFDFLYWSRWQGAEPASRFGTELAIVAQKKSET